MSAEIDQGYSGKRTAEIVGITYRQLDYWARTDLVRPSLQSAQGSGSRRLYSYRDLLELKVIKSLNPCERCSTIFATTSVKTSPASTW